MKNERESLVGRLEGYEKSCGAQPAAGKSLPDLKTLTSAAAGLGLLLACPHAEAAIQWSGARNIHISVSNNPTYSLDMDGGGAIDFYLVAGTWGGGGAAGREVYITTGSSFASWLATTTSYYVAKLSGGYTIAPSASLWTYSYGSLAYTGNFSGGNFLHVPGYIGVRFELNGDTKYGWIDFEGDANDGGQGTIYGWAYEDVTDAPIIAGDTGAAIPTLNEWGMIILVGLLAAGGLVYGRKEEEIGV